MATYEPDPALFRAQVESLRAQAGCRWHCFVSDDGSAPEALAAIEAEIGGDARFTLSPSPGRLGFYRNFERAIAMVPEEYELIALSDQDDRWHTDKLAILAAALRDRPAATLAYSDQRLVREDGWVISETYWTGRSNNHSNLASLLIANTVTGAASMFRRSVVDRALPFPEVPGEQYHDHWLGLVALAMGELAYVDRPLYDYVQHGSAVLGHEKANAGLRSSGIRRLDPRRWREILGGWGSAYFDVYLRLKALAQILLERCSDELTPAKRRALTRFATSDRSVAGFLWLLLRPLRRLAGHDETLGIERVLARGVLYRHLAAVKRRLPARLRRGPAAGGELKEEAEITPRMRQKVAPLFPVVSKEQPRRVNLLIPTFDLDHFFGGYIAKLSLARRLAERGAPVRVVTVDPTPPLPDDWQARIESFRELEGTFGKVEVAFGRDGREPLRLSPDDRFIATTWWTAHIATRLAKQTAQPRFLYLIQEYEPLTVPRGAWRELAEASYGFPHNALFSTAILRRYFEQEGIGVFAEGVEAGRERALDFANAITPVRPPSEEEMAARERPALLFYARPESHAARNLYEVGVEALRLAISRGAFHEGWRFVGIGSTGPSRTVDLGSGRELELMPRTGQDSYGEFLSRHDLGMALMDAPHPSLVPMEMAAAGMTVVTTTYGASKTPESLEAISSNLLAVEPKPEAVAEALGRAAARTPRHGARLEGSKVDWPDSWSEALSDERVAEILRLLEKT